MPSTSPARTSNAIPVSRADDSESGAAARFRNREQDGTHRRRTIAWIEVLIASHHVPDDSGNAGVSRLQSPVVMLAPSCSTVVRSASDITSPNLWEM